MDALKYKHKLGQIARCKVTDFTGTLVAVRQGINGAVCYAIQPSSKKDENWIQEAKTIDEDDISIIGLIGDAIEQSAEFAFSCGQKVRNIINGFEGVIVARSFWKNGCTMYCLESKCITTEKGIQIPTKTFWEQEIELVKEGNTIEPPTKKRGGPIMSFENIKDF